MQSLPHSALNTDQLAQVAYLFADEFFGTDAGAFDYLVEGGRVTGRRLQVAGLKIGKIRAAGDVRVIAQEDTQVTDEFMSMHMSTGALVALLTEKFTNTFEEVHHE